MKTEQTEGSLATPPTALATFRTSVALYAFTPSPSEGPSPASGLRRSARTAARLQYIVKKEEPADGDDDVLPTINALPTPPGSSRKRKASKMEEEDEDFKANGIGKTPSKVQKGKFGKRGYAPPETYAHLRELNDHLAENLDVMFCGINPGQMSAQKGHHFAHPTNHFWRCLFHSGLTSRLLPATEDYTLPVLFNLGLTNLVDRPSAEAAELSREEMSLSVPSILRKIQLHRPRIICFVGKGIWQAVERVLKKSAVYPEVKVEEGASAEDEKPAVPTKGKGKAKAKKKSDPDAGLGLQPLKVVHAPKAEEGAILETLFYVVPSTSGRVISHQLPDKIRLFTILKGHVDDSKAGTLDTSAMAVVSVD
ncbi:DNA glycosylase [Dentipellis sp. KUC8613]|nr:DNA glycosylase [Dentipellis sp. KUC8613]